MWSSMKPTNFKIQPVTFGTAQHIIMHILAHAHTCTYTYTYVRNIVMIRNPIYWGPATTKRLKLATCTHHCTPITFPGDTTTHSTHIHTLTHTHTHTHTYTHTYTHKIYMHIYTQRGNLKGCIMQGFEMPKGAGTTAITT